MARTQARYWLLGSLGFIALGGIFGGIAMIAKPDGSILHTSLVLLKHAPVKTYTWPGVFLLVFMGLWPAINIYGVLKQREWALKSSMIFGLFTVLWIVYETITIHTFSPLQPLIALLGAVVAYFAYVQIKAKDIH